MTNGSGDELMSRAATRLLSLSPTVADALLVPAALAATPITAVVARFGGVIDCGLAGMLDEMSGLRVLASGLELAELEAVVAGSRPHVAVLNDADARDISVFGRLRQAQPGLGLVVLGHRLSHLHAVRLLALGANACVAHEAASQEVISAAVRIASERGRMLAAGDVDRTDDRLGLLTPRETEVFMLLCDGRTNAEVAAALTISEETARKHAQRVRGKLGIRGSRQLRVLNAALIGS